MAATERKGRRDSTGAGGQEKNRIHRTTRNGAWLSAVHHRLNGMELSREEFRDNLRLRYGMMPQDIPATCDGCGKKFSTHDVGQRRVDRVLARRIEEEGEVEAEAEETE